jgi:hypothetical protein
MNKGIGLNRMILLPWLDATAELRLQSDNLAAMRQGLQVVVGRDLHGVDAIRKTVDVLVNIWQKSVGTDSYFLDEALQFFPRLAAEERIWLHYGLTLISYPFFRQCAALFGQYGRIGESIPGKVIKERLATELGQLGSLNRSAQYVVASLWHWGVLSYSSKGHLYTPKMQSFTSGNSELEIWLLSCALQAHPAEELTVADLLRLPELFPFKFTITIDQLRKNSHLTIQRQGSWDMIRLKD